MNNQKLTFTPSSNVKDLWKSNPNEMKLWVDGLRSGKYKQISRVMSLAEEGTACCLHVLQCEVANKGKWVYIKGAVPSYSDNPVMLNDELPEDIAIADVSSDSIIPFRHNRKVQAHHLNDKYKLSFEQIADILEGKVAFSEYVVPNYLSAAGGEE